MGNLCKELNNDYLAERLIGVVSREWQSSFQDSSWVMLQRRDCFGKGQLVWHHSHLSPETVPNEDVKRQNVCCTGDVFYCTGFVSFGWVKEVKRHVYVSWEELRGIDWKGIGKSERMHALFSIISHSWEFQGSKTYSATFLSALHSLFCGICLNVRQPRTRASRAEVHQHQKLWTETMFFRL